MNPESTWLQPEERAYTARGAQLRKGRARCEDGTIRTVYAGIPDTYFTVPAHCRINGKYTAGYVHMRDGEYLFSVPDKGKEGKSV